MEKEKIFILIYIAAICVCFILGGTVAYKTWDLGSDRDDYEIICLDNYEYYRANFMAKGFLSIKLDNNGKPIYCE